MLFTLPCGVTGSTEDFESEDVGSNPAEATSVAWQALTMQGRNPSGEFNEGDMVFVVVR